MVSKGQRVHVLPSKGCPTARGGSPSVETPEEAVQEIRAGGETLGQAVGRVPGGAVDAAVAKATDMEA